MRLVKRVWDGAPPGLQASVAACLHDGFGGTGPVPDLPDLHFTAQVWGLEDGGLILCVGFLSFKGPGKRPAPVLHDLATRSQVQNRGLASWLIAAMQAELRGLGFAELRVQAASPDLVSFYSRFGFRPFGKRGRLWMKARLEDGELHGMRPKSPPP